MRATDNEPKVTEAAADRSYKRRKKVRDAQEVFRDIGSELHREATRHVLEHYAAKRHISASKRGRTRYLLPILKANEDFDTAARNLVRSLAILQVPIDGTRGSLTFEDAVKAMGKRLASERPLVAAVMASLCDVPYSRRALGGGNVADFLRDRNARLQEVVNAVEAAQRLVRSFNQSFGTAVEKWDATTNYIRYSNRAPRRERGAPNPRAVAERFLKAFGLSQAKRRVLLAGAEVCDDIPGCELEHWPPERPHTETARRLQFRVKNR